VAPPRPTHGRAFLDRRVPALVWARPLPDRGGREPVTTNLRGRGTFPIMTTIAPMINISRVIAAPKKNVEVGGIQPMEVCSAGDADPRVRGIWKRHPEAAHRPF